VDATIVWQLQSIRYLANFLVNLKGGCGVCGMQSVWGWGLVGTVLRGFRRDGFYGIQGGMRLRGFRRDGVTVV
jgi:hypothetical protein